MQPTSYNAASPQWTSPLIFNNAEFFVETSSEPSEEWHHSSCPRTHGGMKSEENALRETEVSLSHFEHYFGLNLSRYIPTLTLQEREFFLSALSALEKYVPNTMVHILRGKLQSHINSKPFGFFLSELWLLVLAHEKSSYPLQQWLKGEIPSFVDYFLSNFRKHMNQAKLTESKAFYGLDFIATTFIANFLIRQSKVNVGGAYAVRYLLQHTFFKSLFTPSSKHLLNNIFEQLLYGKKLAATLDAVELPHPVYFEEIRITHKFQRNKPVTKELVQKAYLLALLTELRQDKHHGNCTYIATFNYVRYTDASLCIRHFSHVLGNEYVEFQDEEIRVPLSMIWQNKQAWKTHPFEAPVLPNQLSSISLQLLLQNEGLNPSDLASELKPSSSMGDFFDALGRKTGSPEVQAYAEKCYLSFDTPWLIRLTSTATDFYLNNAHYNEEGETSCKQELINSRFYISLFHNLRNSFQAQSSDAQLANRLTQASFFLSTELLDRNLWIDDDFVLDPSIRDETDDPPQSTEDKLRLFLQHHRRCFFYEGRKEDIASFSEYREKLRTKLLTRLQPFLSEDNETFDSLEEPLKEEVLNYNQEEKSFRKLFETDEFSALDSLTLAARGRPDHYILDHIFHVKSQLREFRAKDVGSFLREMTTLLQPSTARVLPKAVMASAKNHSFVLFPEEFEFLLQDETKITEEGTLLENLIDCPAQYCLHQKIMHKETKAQLIDLLDIEEEEKKQLKADSEIQTAFMNGVRFKQFIIGKCGQEAVTDDFKTLFNNYFHSIHLPELSGRREEFLTQLQSLGIFPSFDQKLRFLFDQLTARLGQGEFMTPSVLASYLTPLFEYSIGRTIEPPGLIAKELCRFNNIPLTIDIGDLNWGMPQDPYSLAIGYDFFLEKTIFLKRTRKTQEAYFKQDSATSNGILFRMFLPKTKLVQRATPL